MASGGGPTPEMEAQDQTRRRLVVCCDGTGNEIAGNQSNVLKFYRVLKQTSKQIIFYDSGVGTISDSGSWTGWASEAKGVFGLLTGYGLDDNVLDAYRFIIRNWRLGDDLYLFGFSRGAYTVRVLAGLIRLVGILRPHQEHLAPSALITYKRADTSNMPDLGYQMQETLRTPRATIRFMGCWDTVGSVIIPRSDRLYIPSVEDLPAVRRNSAVQVFRHALAIDERRRMYRPVEWEEPQRFKPSSYLKDDDPQLPPQDIRQVWFAGVHADIGGGYPEAKSGAAKYPLAWMVDEARQHGLEFRERMVKRLVHGQLKVNDTRRYVAPDLKSELHNSMTCAWQLLEYLPNPTSGRADPRRRRGRGFYLPRGEPRFISKNALLHSSVLERIRLTEGMSNPYRPPNLANVPVIADSQP